MQDLTLDKCLLYFIYKSYIMREGNKYRINMCCRELTSLDKDII